jgi:hypothetical protein
MANGPSSDCGKLMPNPDSRVQPSRTDRLVKIQGSLFWGLQLLFWFAVSAFFYHMNRHFLVPPLSGADALTIAVTRFCIAIPISTALGWGFESLSHSGRSRRQFFGIALLLIVIASVAETYLFLYFLSFKPGFLVEIYENRHIKSFTLLLNRIEFLGTWSLMFFGLFFWKQLQSVKLQMAQAESALLASELSRLQLQIHPHFLFNSLTAVLACRHNPDDVSRVVIGLSEYLRFCLTRQEMLAPLDVEIEALKQYVVVEKYRFRENLDCQVACTPGAAAAVVPAMIITPLLENAFKYGGRTTKGKLIVKVDCQIQLDRLIITVFNTGYWIEPTSVKVGGLGLANLRSRLSLLGLADAQLECGPFAADPLQKGVRCQLILPLRLDFPNQVLQKPSPTSLLSAPLPSAPLSSAPLSREATRK